MLREAAAAFDTKGLGGSVDGAIARAALMFALFIAEELDELSAVATEELEERPEEIVNRGMALWAVTRLACIDGDVDRAEAISARFRGLFSELPAAAPLLLLLRQAEATVALHRGEPEPALALVRRYRWVECGPGFASRAYRSIFDVGFDAAVQVAQSGGRDRAAERMLERAIRSRGPDAQAPRALGLSVRALIRHARGDTEGARVDAQLTLQSCEVRYRYQRWRCEEAARAVGLDDPRPALTGGAR